MRRRIFAVAATGAVLSGCATPANEPKVPVVESTEGWSFDPWFNVPADSNGLLVQFVRAHDSGFDIAYDDYTTGSLAAPGLVLGSVRDGRFTYRYPGLGDCGVSTTVLTGSEARVSCESGAWNLEVDDLGTIEKLPFSKLEPPSPIPGIGRCPTLRRQPDGVGRLPSPLRGNADIVEHGEGSERTIQAVILVANETVPSVRASQQRTLRYAVCTPVTGEERIVELSKRATSAAITVDPRGEPAVAFVEQFEGRARLVLARRHAVSIGHELDTRLASSRAACAALHVKWFGPRAPEFTPLTPEEKLCSVMMRQEEASAAAKEATLRECEAGDARACWLGGSVRSQLMRGVSFHWEAKDSTVNRHMSTRFLSVDPHHVRDPSAFGFFERGCDLGDMDSCTRVLTEDQHLRTRSPLAEAQCNAGNEFACKLVEARRQ